jgi:hypothetical protein
MKVRHFATRGLKSPTGYSAILSGMWASTTSYVTCGRAGLAWRRLSTDVLLLATLVVLTLSWVQSTEAQTYTMLHAFSGRPDGAYPLAGLTVDRAGNLYGTTWVGGRESCGGSGCGMAFRLSNRGSDWTFTPLYSFDDHQLENGALPTSITFGPDGSLYGTTQAGGTGCTFGDPDGPRGCGTVYRLRPSPTPCTAALCPWVETVLYRFRGSNGGDLVGDGANPLGALAFDTSGNIYGTTLQGGGCGLVGCGTVYELTPSANGWTESMIHLFTDGSDGANPQAGVIVDQSGKLYGTTVSFQHCCGTIYQLTPAGSGWVENTLHTFTNGDDGSGPSGGLIFDASGNLYGATIIGGSAGGSTVYELKPAGINWAFDVVYALTGSGGGEGNMAMDAAGNLYGETFAEGAYGYGSVFKLTRTAYGWSYTDLHDFNDIDGKNPVGGVMLDAQGNLYGTTSDGGPYHCGVVWEITQ